MKRLAGPPGARKEAYRRPESSQTTFLEVNPHLPLAGTYLFPRSTDSPRRRAERAGLAIPSRLTKDNTPVEVVQSKVETRTTDTARLTRNKVWSDLEDAGTIMRSGGTGGG